MVHGDQKKLLVCSNPCSTSDARPLSKLANVVVRVGIKASGEVPAMVLGNGKLDFLLDGGERKGLGCNFTYFSTVISVFLRDLCVFSPSYGVICNFVVHPLYGI